MRPQEHSSPVCNWIEARIRAQCQAKIFNRFLGRDGSVNKAAASSTTGIMPNLLVWPTPLYDWRNPIRYRTRRKFSPECHLLP
jgi:hypothetical protein